MWIWPFSGLETIRSRWSREARIRVCRSFDYRISISVRILMPADAKSLNVSVAVGIGLYERPQRDLESGS